jgi:hypothetical protein
MNRNFYHLAISFTVLYFLVILLHSSLYLYTGGRVYLNGSIDEWIVVVGAAYFLASSFLINYFHHKQYRLAFIATIVALIGFFVHVTVIYISLTSGNLDGISTITNLTYLGTGILGAMTLTFSASGKRPWLKTAGIVWTMHPLILLSLTIMFLTDNNASRFATYAKIDQWASLFACLLPVTLILNFLNELRMSNEETEDPALGQPFEGMLLLTGIILLVCGFFFGQKLTGESLARTYWVERRTERAQGWSSGFEARTYTNSRGQTLLYRLMKPLDYEPQKNYPLVVCLHGGGGWGSDNVIQIDGSMSAQILSWDENRKKYPAFLFVPQCPPAFSWGGLPKFPGIDSLVFEAIAELENEFTIDVKRRYVLGESLGGYGTWHFIGTRSGMFAAAIPVCGAGSPTLAKNMVDVAVWAFHGRKDANVPVSGSADVIEAIRKAGGNPRYTEYENEGHGIAHLVYHDTPGLLEWVFSQKRK